LRGATSTASAREDAGRRDLGPERLEEIVRHLAGDAVDQTEPTCANFPPTCAFAV